MNVTKRMFRSGVAAWAIAIGSQTLAAPIISESFEGTNGVGWANGSLVTNLMGWSSTGGDLSAITNWNNAYPSHDTVSPLTNSVTHTNVVQLATEGGMLSFTNGTAETLVDNNLYVDAMVKFVISDSFNPVFFFLIEGDPEYIKTLLTEFVIYFNNIRILLTARTTPCCPKIDKEKLCSNL
jgi:hypothetical protein